MINDLEKLMSFYSITSDQTAVSRLLDYVENRLLVNGLSVERFQRNGINSLYASTSGTRTSKVMLQGHIDVVPGEQSFRRQGSKIYGRGSYDMLFGAASFLRLVDELDNVQSYDLSILLTGDEEIGGANGVSSLLEDPGFMTDICILPDAGEGIGSMNIAAKGTIHAQIQVNGQAHHGSRPWEGDGAAGKLVKLLHELNAEFDDSDRFNSTITISQLDAGTSALNQGPSTARAGFDIRTKDDDDTQRIKSALNRILKKYDAEIVYEHNGLRYSLDMQNPLVASFVKTYGDLTGQTITFTKAHGSSDARFFDAKGIPVIMFRPDGGGAHGDNEWLSIPVWEKFHEVLTTYVLTASRINEV